jgi:hypothetical protein
MGQSYDVTGEIHFIGQTESFGASNFEKREFIIKITGPDESEQYPNHLKLEVVKDKCPMLDTYQIGQEIKIYFNLRGRLWQGNGKPETCFNSLQAWKIEAMQQAPPQQQQQAPAPTQAQVPAQQQFDDMDVQGDEIPF